MDLSNLQQSAFCLVRAAALGAYLTSDSFRIDNRALCTNHWCLMFLEPSFLFPATLIALFQFGLLFFLIQGIRSEKQLAGDAGDATDKQVKEARNATIISKVAIVPFLVICAVLNVTGIQEHVSEYREKASIEATNSAVRPLIVAAASRPFDLICTRNGYLANDTTLESDKVACAQAGEFRVVSHSPVTRDMVVFFKVVGPRSILPVNSPSWRGFGLDESVATLSELKTAFNVSQ